MFRLNLNRFPAASIYRTVPIIVSMFLPYNAYSSVWTELIHEPSNLPTDKLGLKGAEQRLSIKGFTFVQVFIASRSIGATCFRLLLTASWRHIQGPSLSGSRFLWALPSPSISRS